MQFFTVSPNIKAHFLSWCSKFRPLSYKGDITSDYHAKGHISTAVPPSKPQKELFPTCLSAIHMYAIYMKKKTSWMGKHSLERTIKLSK